MTFIIHINIIITLKAQGNKISVEIENEGSFIESEDLDRIWDKFYKGTTFR